MRLQGYLDHKKLQPARTLQQDCVEDPMVALGGGAVSYVQDGPVHPCNFPHWIEEKKSGLVNFSVGRLLKDTRRV